MSGQWQWPLAVAVTDGLSVEGSNRRWQLAEGDSVPDRGSFHQMRARGRTAKRVVVGGQLELVGGDDGQLGEE